MLLRISTSLSEDMRDSRRIHPANTGRSSEPVLWGFEGNQLLFVAAGFGVSLAVFRILHGAREWEGLPALIVAALPLVAAITWVLLLMAGKPKRFANEFLEWLLLRFQLRVDWPASFLAPSNSSKAHPILRSDESEN